jgi:acyl-CoA thioester hydrolase
VTVAFPAAGGAHGFRHRVDVRFFEVDSLGVVFNMWYLGWCDEAMSGYLDFLGHGPATLRADGLDAVLRKAELEWVDSLQAFDRAEIGVRVEHVGATSFRLRYDVRRVDDHEPDGVPCAAVAITYVCVRAADRRTTPLPCGLRAALEAGSS